LGLYLKLVYTGYIVGFYWIKKM